MKIILLKLYKTAFWVSFAVMVSGLGAIAFEITNHIKSPLSDQIFIFRSKNNVESYFNFQPIPPMDSERISTSEDMKSSINSLLFEYERPMIFYMIVFVFQFFSIILLKRWLVWIVGKSQT